ncbi:MAG: PIG-L deacetylase family protein [Thermodesulfobacteriota bacterium]
MNVLVLAAHPDDEVLGCGGTMARLAAEGCRVSVAILGQGAASRHAPGSPEAAAEVEALQARSREAARILGAAEVLHFGLPDNRFDSLDMLDVVKTVEDLGRRLRPEVVYAQHGGDLNVDHAVTFRAALTAFRPLPGSTARALYAYEVASSTEWAFGQFAPAFRPDTFVDVTAFLDSKMEALAAYEGEVRPFPHPRSERAVRAQAELRGAAVGAPAAEAFVTVWRKV